MANTTLKKRPVALIILSGFGWAPPAAGNAIAQAKTPFLNSYLSEYKHTLLEASGERVGLPMGQAGNSEISHLIIGTGQAPPMEITRIDEAINTGSFFQNPALTAACTVLPSCNSSRIRSKIKTFESTAIPSVRIMPAMPGKVNVAPNPGTARSPIRMSKLSARARLAMRPEPR